MITVLHCREGSGPRVVPEVAPYSITAGVAVPRALGTCGEARPSPGCTIGLGRDQDWAGAGQRSRIAIAEDRHRVAGNS